MAAGHQLIALAIRRPAVHILQHCPQDLSSLLKRRLRPFFLRFGGFGQGSVNAIRSGWIDITEQLSGRRIVALDGARAWSL